MVVSPTRRKEGAVTVRCDDERDLKIPCWMLSPAAAEFELTDEMPVL